MGVFTAFRAIAQYPEENSPFRISGDHPGQRSADYTRQELTRRFAANPGRQGVLTSSRLYSEILPQLMARGQCRIRSKVGKRTTYTFQWD